MEKSFSLGNCLNLGCGYDKQEGFVNVDAFEICKPDVVWDLNNYPWPWEDGMFDFIYAHHIFEHLDDYWAALTECSRILRDGGRLDVHVPDESSPTALTYRDHKRVISWNSFLGIQNIPGSEIMLRAGTNAWARSEPMVPLAIVRYSRVPNPQYTWMAKWCPWLLRFCAEHLRGFMWEQKFEFHKQPKGVQK